MLRKAGLTTAMQIGMWAVVPSPITTEIAINDCRPCSYFGVFIDVSGRFRDIAPCSAKFGLSIVGLTLAALGVFSALPIIIATPMSCQPAGATPRGLPM